MDAIDGQTEIDPDEQACLIPSLVTRAELNAFEQRNILSAFIWARRSRTLRNSLLSLNSLLLLHRKMFDETWSWAGQLRTTGKNIGVEPHQIRTQLAQFVGDANYWLENEIYPIHEAAVRIHHKLVVIHPFANGNGRHARMVADLLLYYRNAQALSWGGVSLDVEGQTRRRYLAALKEADRGRFKLLLEFATSD